MELIEIRSNDRDLSKIAELYCITFNEKAYIKENVKNALHNVKKHMGYQGFKGVKAVNSNGNIAGFAYGYTSLPKQFYREKVAAQLTEQEQREWLDDCFEFVELAVHPTQKRQGIGGELHDALLQDIPHRTAVLTTSVENTPALTLYKKMGWEVIRTNAPVLSSDYLQVIMGKTCNQSM